jgi:hypothetical protein
MSAVKASIGHKAVLADQVSLKTSDGRQLACLGSAAVFGVLVGGLIGGLTPLPLALDSLTPQIGAAVTPLISAAVLFLAGFAYTKLFGQRLLPALLMCALSLAYLAWLLVQPPTWAQYPAAHYIAAAACILFALQGARGALATARASRDSVKAL